MGRRIGALAAALAAAAAVAAATTADAPGAARRLPDWARPQIATVVAHGLLGASSVGSFRPNDALTRGALVDLAAGLTQELGPAPAADRAPDDSGSTVPATTTTTTTSTTAQGASPDAPVTMTELDRRLVLALGLGRAAQEFAAGARAAGLPVPARFGTEVVARLLGLRLNHPAAQDYLELRPQDTATRAEAAYSAAQILALGPPADSPQVAWVQSLADSFSLPKLSTWQKAILTTAFGKIGMPYVWGGTSDGAEVDFGVPARGGYDCSGFVWRVYKLQSYPDEQGLAATIQGRTTYVMSVEVPRSERIPRAQLEPADVLFFGTRGPRSTGRQIVHAAIYAGNGWLIQSSSEGVALAPLEGWYSKKFAWARRPLREAGLEQ